MIEIVVVEEGDNPQPIEGVKYIFLPRLNKGFGFTRNTAVNNCSNSLIAFVDDDCIVTRNWLNELINTLDEKTTGVTGAVKVTDCNVIGYCENLLGFPAGGLKKIHASGNNPQPTNDFVTCNALIRKAAIISIGGFEERPCTRLGGEDSLLAYNLLKEGYHFVYSPNAIVFHKTKNKLKDILFWAIRMGKSRFFFNEYIGKRQPILERLRHSVIMKMLLFLLGLIIFYRHALIYSVSILAFYWLKTFYDFKSYKQYLDKYYTIMFVLPIVKFTFDTGLDYGQLTALFSESRKKNK
jgi:GT2 family glycosyltransferase